MLKSKNENFVFYSIAIDVSTDTKILPKGLFYGVIRNFTVVKKIDCSIALKGTTRDSDLYTYLKNILAKCEQSIYYMH